MQTIEGVRRTSPNQDLRHLPTIVFRHPYLRKCPPQQNHRFIKRRRKHKATQDDFDGGSPDVLPYWLEKEFHSVGIERSMVLDKYAEECEEQLEKEQNHLYQASKKRQMRRQKDKRNRQKNERMKTQK